LFAVAAGKSGMFCFTEERFRLSVLEISVSDVNHKKKVVVLFKAFAFVLFFMIAVFSTVEIYAAQSGNETEKFRIKYVYGGSVYIGSGSGSGLEAGQRLVVSRVSAGMDSENSETIGEIELESITPTSAAGKILYEKSEIVPGDIAYIDRGIQTLPGSTRDLQNVRKSPPAAKSVQDKQPQNPQVRKSASPSQHNANRFRGRIGVDYSTLQVPASEAESSQLGFFLRLDASRLAGTHWNIQGYHRGRFQSRTNSAGEETLNDLINRTYRLNINYENPDSNWVVGAGRLYLPWASSLDTMDGMYLGRKFGNQTAGFFMGTAPDPTSWNYSPDRRLGGVFYNIENGSFESFRFDSSTGIALSWLQWKPERKFGFFENNLFYKRYLSIYSNIEVDLLTGARNNNKTETVLSRSYFSIRVQPHKRINFNANHNYFRNIPTFDTRLIGTGLLDDFLFQGFSGGFRLSLPYNLRLYGKAGRSSRTGDQKASWNYLAGASIADIVNSGILLGFRYSRFDSSFGRGTYQSLSLAREIGNRLQFELQGGQQDFKSLFTSQDRARFFNGTVDWFLGRQYFFGGGVTVYRGQVQEYNQIFLRLGYRFDTRNLR